MTESIEPILSLLLYLAAIAAFGLAAWIALRDRWEKWVAVAGALAISAYFAETVPLLLFGWTLVAAVSFPVMNALSDRWTWLGRFVFVALGVLPLLSSSLRLSRVFEWSMLLSATVVVIWMVRPSTDAPMRVAYARGLFGWSAICFLPIWLFLDLTPFERTISSALRGEIVGRIQWEAGPSGDSRAWLSELPPLADVRCGSRQIPDGACCLATFADGRKSEIHIYRTHFGRYAVRKFTHAAYGKCRNPDFDPGASSGDPRKREFVPCEELRPPPEAT